MYHSLIIHSSTDGRLCYSFRLDILNKVVMNVHVFELERGFSLSYGDEGEAGQKSGYLDSDFEL